MNGLAHELMRYVVPCTFLAACQATHPLPAAAAPAGGAPPAGGSGGISRQLIERGEVPDLPDWETRVYLIEYPPGASAPPHVHPAVGLGYVLEGRFESAFEGEEPVVVDQGKSFVDRAGIVHTLFRNPDRDHVLRFLIAYTIRRGEEPFRAAPTRSR